MSRSPLGRAFSIETFGSVDGPGIRFVLFLTGCPFRCLYCHNPESWEGKDSFLISSQEVLTKALRYKAYWGKEGGLTVSGGEPLTQIDFLIDLFSLFRKEGISTCLDTSLASFSFEENFFGKFTRLMEVTDLFLVDIKEMDGKRHQVLTGRGNENVLSGIRYLDEKGKRMWIRHVLVPGYTDFDEDLRAMRKFLDGLSHVERIEVLPYHTLAISKYEKLALPYPLLGVPSPTKERFDKAIKILGAL